MLPQGITRWVAWTVVGFQGQTSQQLDGARPAHLGADGVKAYQHDRRVAPAITLTLRRSLTAPFEKQTPSLTGVCCLPMPTVCKNCVSAETSLFTSSRVLDCSLESFFERQFQRSHLTRSFLVSFLGGSNGLMSGNWREFQGLCVSTSVSTARSKIPSPCS